jgi:peroxiredoxin
MGALALLLLFVAAIAVNLARGRKPDCRCFGRLSSRPVGWSTVARNVGLAAVAGFVVAEGHDDPGRSTMQSVADLTGAQLASVVAGGIIVALLAVGAALLLNLMRQNGRLLLRLEALEARVDAGGIPVLEPAAVERGSSGLPVGSPAPGFNLAGLYGEVLTLDALRAAGKPVLLVFSDPGCGPCNALLPEIGRWQRDHAASLTIAVVSRGSADANRAKSAEHGLTNVLLQQEREVAEAYEETGTPCAVVVRSDGTIGSALAAGADAIRALVARTAGLPEPATAAAAPSTAQGNGSRPKPAIGDRAPELQLPDLSGRTIKLSQFRGTKTLVVFWNPGCGFCEEMLDDLKSWEASRPKRAPKLLVVSTGTPEANRAQGFRSPVVLDQAFSAGPSFGANGTPMAVLVDEKGRIASHLAAGAPAVLELAGAGARVKQPA